MMLLLLQLSCIPFTIKQKASKCLPLHSFLISFSSKPFQVNVPSMFKCAWHNSIVKSINYFHLFDFRRISERSTYAHLIQEEPLHEKKLFGDLSTCGQYFDLQLLSSFVRILAGHVFKSGIEICQELNFLRIQPFFIVKNEVF